MCASFIVSSWRITRWNCFIHLSPMRDAPLFLPVCSATHQMVWYLRRRCDRILGFLFYFFSGMDAWQVDAYVECHGDVSWYISPFFSLPDGCGVYVHINSETKLAKQPVLTLSLFRCKLAEKQVFFVTRKRSWLISISFWLTKINWASSTWEFQISRLIWFYSFSRWF